ncbi:MAG: hypothetical protein WBC74_05775 [Candidatus Omnitrophota bacterium]
MNRIRNLKMKDVDNEDIFSIYTEYVKEEITKDLGRIYEDEARLVDSEEPWVFKLDN